MNQQCHAQFKQVIDLLAHNQPLYFALGDKARQEIIILLAQHDQLSVGELTSHTRLSRPAVSHHLKILKQAGLLRETRRGVKRYYHPTFKNAIESMERLVNTVHNIKELII